MTSMDFISYIDFGEALKDAWTAGWGRIICLFRAEVLIVVVVEGDSNLGAPRTVPAFPLAWGSTSVGSTADLQTCFHVRNLSLRA